MLHVALTHLWLPAHSFLPARWPRLWTSVCPASSKWCWMCAHTPAPATCLRQAAGAVGGAGRLQRLLHPCACRRSWPGGCAFDCAAVCLRTVITCPVPLPAPPWCRCSSCWRCAASTLRRRRQPPGRRCTSRVGGQRMECKWRWGTGDHVLRKWRCGTGDCGPSFWSQLAGTMHAMLTLPLNRCCAVLCSGGPRPRPAGDERGAGRADGAPSAGAPAAVRRARSAVSAELGTRSMVPA